MKPFKIKVCGMTQPEQVKMLVDLGVDYSGFIFYPPSPRYVLNHLSLDQISSFKDIEKVGVFVNEDYKILKDTIEKAQLEVVQLHGDESLSYVQKIRQDNKKIEIIKVFSLQKVDVKVLENIEKYTEIVDFFLFDTPDPKRGGTGRKFKWELLKQATWDKPYFLSGGISLDDIPQITSFEPKPYAIDINSKFETQPGIKDLDKINTMIKITRQKI